MRKLICILAAAGFCAAPLPAQAEVNSGFGAYFANTALPGFEDHYATANVATADMEALANIEPAAGDDGAAIAEGAEAFLADSFFLPAAE